MPTALKLEFAPLAAAPKGVLVVLCEEGLKYSSAARKATVASGDLLARAAAAESFNGKSGSALEIVAPSGLDLARLEKDQQGAVIVRHDQPHGCIDERCSNSRPGGGDSRAIRRLRQARPEIRAGERHQVAKTGEHLQQAERCAISAGAPGLVASQPDAVIV